VPVDPARHRAVPGDGLAASCRELVQIYPAADRAVAALRGVDADFERGSITMVTGPSGAGKSTFLRLLACLERPSAGDVVISGEPTALLGHRARRRLAARRLGYVFQRPAENLLEYLTVAEHMTMAARMRATASRRSDAATPAPADQGAIDSLLAATDLTDLTGRRPRDLSAGEQQRLAFAMAVVGEPALVIADEPSAELDPAATTALADLLKVLSGLHTTLVVASHDPVLMAVADQVLVIRGGMLAARGTGTDPPLPVLDATGRIQLPDEAAGLFPGGQARIEADGDSLRIERP
jgi:putative ABC transport system ATP-binding protein